MRTIGSGKDKIYPFDAVVNDLPYDDLAKEPLTSFIQSSSQAREGVPGGLATRLARLDARNLLSYSEIDTLSIGKTKYATVWANSSFC
ncbi:MAG: hypothetical protein LBT52_04080, partial [Clostridiales Family XIII bacterium]|nr:hypothetical protein [Clostridiales Family XIII bacterium]